LECNVQISLVDGAAPINTGRSGKIDALAGGAGATAAGDGVEGEAVFEFEAPSPGLI